MKNIKGLIISLSIVTILLVLAVPAFAENIAYGSVDIERELYYSASRVSEDSVRAELISRLNEAASRYETNPIDISDLNISYPNDEYISVCFSEVASLPTNFHLMGYGYSYYENGSYISIILKYNTADKETWEEYTNSINREYANICTYLDDDMSQIEKMLVVHDYMCINYEYDYVRLEEGTLPAESFTAYGIMENKIGVCQAYAEAYMLVLYKLGYECRIVASTEMNHAWNIVKIDDNWYHVDVTWDDPVPNDKGRTLHKYFLVSDETMLTVTDGDAGIDGYDHFGWTSPYACTDNTYETDTPWSKTEKQIQLDKNSIYAMETGGYVVAYDRKTWESRQVFACEDKIEYVHGAFNAAEYNFTYIVVAGSRIYFNTPNEIRSVNRDGADMKTHVKLPDGDGYIYLMRGNSSVIEYSITEAPFDDLVLEHFFEVPIGLDIPDLENGFGVGGSIELSRLISSGGKREELVWTVSNPEAASIVGDRLYFKSREEFVLSVSYKSDASSSCEIALKADFVYGDADGNGEFDLGDLIVMAQLFAGWDVDDILGTGYAYRFDADGDATNVSMTDLVAFSRIMVGLFVDIRC